MRSSGGTRLGLPWVVVVSTNSMMLFLASPSFHDGSGSWASTILAAQASATVAKPTKVNLLFSLTCDCGIRTLRFFALAVWSGGRPLRTAHHTLHAYWPACDFIVSSICLFTASRLNDAGSCIGG